jgi:PAS domain S-box-containing protein
MRAEEIRTLSESMTTIEAKTTMLRIAADYERLAQLSEVDTAGWATNGLAEHRARRRQILSGETAALEQVNLWLHTALESMVHGLSMFDERQRLIVCNDRYREIYGLTPDQIRPGTTLRSILTSRMVGRTPEDIDACLEDRVRTMQSSESSYAETKLPDGRIIAMDFTAMPGGGWVAIHQDITERKRAEDYQKLLVSELDHRVKNILALVAAVVKHTSEGSSSIDTFMRTLEGRIRSMADAHMLLSQSHWRGVDISELVPRQLAPYTTKANAVIDGPHVILPPAATQALAMVLHELVTNAVKYGSLSSPQGKISITWDHHVGEDRPARVIISWRCSDGPPVTPPTRFGYGTNLIRNLIPHELGGKVDLVFASDGVHCNIEIPLKDRPQDVTTKPN